MTLKFHAKAIHTEQNESHILVGFADDGNQTTEFVMLMRGLEQAPDIPDEVSRSLYFEYNDETMGGHGCVRAMSLGSDRLVIKIDRLRCRQLQHAEFVVTFDPSNERAAKLPGLLAALAGDEVTFQRLNGKA